MLSYKYSFEDVCDRPLLPVGEREKRGWSTTLFFLPVLMIIASILMMYWPIKVAQMIIEKFSD